MLNVSIPHPRASDINIHHAHCPLPAVHTATHSAAPVTLCITRIQPAIKQEKTLHVLHLSVFENPHLASKKTHPQPTKQKLRKAFVLQSRSHKRAAKEKKKRKKKEEEEPDILTPPPLIHLSLTRSPEQALLPLESKEARRIPPHPPTAPESHHQRSHHKQDHRHPGMIMHAASGKEKYTFDPSAGAFAADGGGFTQDVSEGFQNAGARGVDGAAVDGLVPVLFILS
jgi:hypothetical protein